MRLPFWNTFFILFFGLLVVFGLTWLQGVGRLPYWIPPFELFLMSLAVFRLTRLVCYDNIFAFFRDAVAHNDPHSFSGTLSTLVNCPWCTGLWFGFFVPFFYFASPYGWFLILVLAVAALGSFFQILANWIGWQAESKKREVQSIPLPR